MDYKIKAMNCVFITLTKENIDRENIYCAFSDKKCQNSYEAKKAWLKNRQTPLYERHQMAVTARI